MRCATALSALNHTDEVGSFIHVIPVGDTLAGNTVDGPCAECLWDVGLWSEIHDLAHVGCFVGRCRIRLCVALAYDLLSYGRAATYDFLNSVVIRFGSAS